MSLRTILYLTFGGALLWLSACKKPAVFGPPDRNDRVVAIGIGSDSGRYRRDSAYYNFSYDSDKQISGWLYGKGNAHLQVTIGYQSPSYSYVYDMRSFDPANPNFILTNANAFKNKDNNMLAFVIDYFSAPGHVNGTRSYQFTYYLDATIDSEKVDFSGLQQLPERRYHFIWSNGNLISRIDNNSVTTHYDYYNLPAQAGDWFWYRQVSIFGHPVFRTTSLLKSIHDTNGLLMNFTYGFDSNGNMSKMMVAGNTADVGTYYIQRDQ